MFRGDSTDIIRLTILSSTIQRMCPIYACFPVASPTVQHPTILFTRPWATVLCWFTYKTNQEVKTDLKNAGNYVFLRCSISQYIKLNIHRQTIQIHYSSPLERERKKSSIINVSKKCGSHRLKIRVGFLWDLSI